MSSPLVASRASPAALAASALLLLLVAAPVAEAVKFLRCGHEGDGNRVTFCDGEKTCCKPAINTVHKPVCCTQEQRCLSGRMRHRQYMGKPKCVRANATLTEPAEGERYGDYGTEDRSSGTKRPPQRAAEYQGSAAPGGGGGGDQRVPPTMGAFTRVDVDKGAHAKQKEGKAAPPGGGGEL